MFTVQNIRVQFNGLDLFRNVSFIINPRDRMGLVGKNGSGKTTLLRIIVGKLVSEEGEVIIPGEKTLGYLPQEMVLSPHNTVMEETLSAFEEIRAIEKEINRLNREIASRIDYQSKSYGNILQELAELNDKYHLLGGNRLEEDVEKVLLGLGFLNTDFQRKLNEFSYGWQMRVEIAKILLRKPDLLLLDEPTNHLDIESIQWLEEFLGDYPGAVVVVSHDRTFLDNITNRTVEIEFGRIHDYRVPFSDYVLQRELRLESQIAAYNNQQRQIKQIERFIERFRYKNTKARQVQSRVKMLEKIKDIELDELDSSSIQFRFPPSPPSGKIVMEGISLGKKYGSKTVLKDLDFTVIKGDRIAFVGKNGEGKTTLSKIMAGILEHEGELKQGYNVLMNYYPQNPAEMLDHELTVFDTIDKVAVGDIRSRIRTLLGGFLFSGDEIDKKVKVLSGGEKARLALAKLLITPANFLILDEPTNHLDMQSKDILKSALLQFEGTMVIVSHDRDFLRGLTNKVYEFRDRKIAQYFGDIFDFLEARSIRSLKELEKNKGKRSKETGDQPSDNKIRYEKKKQVERDLRKMTSLLGQVEKEIFELEKNLAEMDRLLADPVKMDKADVKGDIFQRYSLQKKKMEDRMEEWENISRQVESLQEEKENF